MKKINLLSFLILMWCYFFVGCGGGNQQQSNQTGKQKNETIVKIALACPLTGDVAAMGLGMKNGAQMAIDEANAKKIVPNVKFELLALDDRANEREAVSVANQIAGDSSVVAIVGHLNSGCSIPASKVYNRNNLLMITPASTNPKLTLQNFKNVFRLCTTDEVQGSFAANLVGKKLKMNKVSVIHDKTAYGQGLAEMFQQTFVKNGGQVLSFDGISQGEKDFKALLTRLKTLNPQAIYFGGLYQEAGLISKQAKELGLKVSLISGDGIFSPEYIKVGGSQTEGDMATMIGVPPSKLKSAAEFLKNFAKKYPGVDSQPYDTYTYEAVNMVIDAVKNVGTDKQKIIDYITKIKYNGILGETTFDKKGDTLNKAITPYIVKGGKWEVLN